MRRQAGALGLALAVGLVNDVEQLHRAAVVGHVELEIERPHMIGPLRPQPIAWHRRVPAPQALSTLLRDPEAFLAPQPLHPLAVDAPALIEQVLMRLAVAPPWPPAREPAQLRPQRRVVLRHERL